MTLPKKTDSKEVGLDLSVALAKYFFNTDYLHYGFWTSDLKLDVSNLAKAQENHSNFLISKLPEKIDKILDVGCGTGKLAAQLMEKGYHVDCVSPSKILANHARRMLGGKSTIFECKYQDLKTENRYDLILFSESFQYVSMEEAFQNTVNFLNDDGYLLMMDFFKTDAEGESPLGGGHHLKEFYNTISKFPFKPRHDIDITTETAPNLKLIDDFLTRVGIPVWNLILSYLAGTSPILLKLLKWKFKKKIENIERKYLSGTRNAENFALFKSYRFLLYQKNGTGRNEQRGILGPLKKK